MARRPLIKKKVKGVDARIRLEKNRFQIEQEAPEINVIREDPGDLRIPGQELKVVQKGVSIQMEHQEGKGMEVVWRKATGEVLRRISVAEVDENGHIHANYKEKIESANAEYGINPDRIRFFGEATKPKTPYEKEMAKWDDGLKRKKFGIENYKDRLKKRSFFARIGDIFKLPRHKASAILRREEKEYNQLRKDAETYFQIGENPNTGEVECIHSADGEIEFTKMLKKKWGNLAQQKPSEVERHKEKKQQGRNQQRRAA